MNTNVQDNNEGLPPFASSSGFANSRKRLRDPTDDEEEIIPKRTVLTENSYNQQPFQPVTQSTPFFAQNNTFDNGVYTDSSLTLNTSSSAANNLFVNLPKQMASQNNNIKTKDDVAIELKQTDALNA
ncbi:hypothetical protein M3Y98_00285300 [Aphelenchoides besseyi]|nr:hypothetical protein M3Y98_00285300 [Aphelenchoides besseyi]